ncbi:hypothetical protein Hypma_002646 [Hypsizygus marmoreus]|uniref:Uncharacterized protein n=1 Tax=Hypsizygus marmoreus TaxID=39966 RepID=A0A369J429_HYPMA|nr:hypothetical protein Hypma_002646 [Hypsizygus marmoreus]
MNKAPHQIRQRPLSGVYRALHQQCPIARLPHNLATLLRSFFSSSPAMDSFIAISAFLNIDTAPPSNEENGGSGNTTYCVVFAKEDVPADEENGGSGNTTYCILAQPAELSPVEFQATKSVSSSSVKYQIWRRGAAM